MLEADPITIEKAKLRNTIFELECQIKFLKKISFDKIKLQKQIELVHKNSDISKLKSEIERLKD